MRRCPPPLRVTFPPPSSTIRGPLRLRTFAVAVNVMVTGSGPHAKVMMPPAATARTTRSEVQLCGVPSPMIRVGWLVSTACASAGTAARPSGLPFAAGAAGLLAGPGNPAVPGELALPATPLRSVSASQPGSTAQSSTATASAAPRSRIRRLYGMAGRLRISIDRHNVRLLVNRLPDSWRITVRRRVIAIVGAAGLLIAGGAIVLSAPADAAVAGLVRVDQVGYLPTDTKVAYLMAPATVTGAKFAVVDSTGATVLSGSVSGTSRGSWNTKYPKVYPITFSGLTTKGTYKIKVTGGATATSPSVRVASKTTIYRKLVADGLLFFQVQRDGPDVIPGALNRKPSHLNDASASVYAIPHFESSDSDVITESDLKKIGGPVNALGGWFDAGDYLKFTHTTAYGDIVLYAAERALGTAAPSTLDTEAHFGTRWLNQMWDQSTRTLYYQVGVGGGNTSGSFTGDHDLWRLPEKDD